ncbi:MAG: xanthine dehydrogenase small subunit [Gammaproteobacteria bacterium]
MDGAGTIRFLLDGQVHEVAGCAPTTTVLEYLRERLGRSGTKEGCAEGDCGACTVVLAELAGAGLGYRAINACIRFLPTLDGKALFTIESLRKADGTLHPAQRAMVECHGSQCGFCTPGFVMSLYALYRTERDPGEAAICHALSGNLCRCTGYRPILAAARRMYEYPAAEAAHERLLRKRLAAIRVTQAKRLEGQGGSYLAPVTVEGVAAALAENPGATILAGGTDVGLRVTKQHADLDHVVYVGNVAGLAVVARTHEFLEIGAAVSLTDAFAALLAEYPDLAEIARRFASPPICNAGTLCGNVANGSPIGDTMPALICLDARVVLASANGQRELPLEDFYLDYMKKDLRPGEFVRALRVPLARPGRVLRSYKVAKRYDQDISAVCGAFALELAGGRVASARVAYGGMAATPRRAPACERALVGASWDIRGIAAAVAALAADFAPITDFRATQEYRARVAGNLLWRLLAETTDRGAAASVWNHAG